MNVILGFIIVTLFTLSIWKYATDIAPLMIETPTGLQRVCRKCQKPIEKGLYCEDCK